MFIDSDSIATEQIRLHYKEQSVNPLTPELNPSAQHCLTRFLLWILLLEPCISLIYT
jgi:hypothetical protein